MDVVPKQRSDTLPSVWDHIFATPIFKHSWATPGHFVMGDS